MHTKMIFRPALKKDLPAIRKIIKPWIAEDSSVSQYLESIPAPGETSEVRSRVLEVDKSIKCVMFWVKSKPDEAQITAMGFGQNSSELGADCKFIQEAILEWSEIHVSKVIIRVPEAVSNPLLPPLKASGFMFEGISSRTGNKQRPTLHLCKHFLYKTVPNSKIMEFLRDFLTSLGYEIRSEDDGFGYRLRTEYRLPFIFSPWHRITKNGPDIIIHPPARILETHELETLFYPLQVHVSGERPLLVPMERKRAQVSIELPDLESRQNTLFAPEAMRKRAIFHNNLAFSLPSGPQTIRRGLPVLFYVNKLGAVGSGRVEDWYLDEPKNLFNDIDDMSFFDPADVVEHAATTGSKAGKVLVIRFQWYRPFKKVISFDEIRRVDENFNPQRTRALSSSLFQTITEVGNEAVGSPIEIN
jgi:hypothetical protein